MNNWPKKPYKWIKDRICYISVPFTWNLPEISKFIKQKHFYIDKFVVGGPAIDLMPDFFKENEFIKLGGKLDGILQKINPLATRTTLGCIRKCKFCGIGSGKIEKDGFVELDDWPDLPIIVDNNILASSKEHFDKVIDRLIKWEWCDFNQGLDARLLSKYHAKRIAEIKRPKCRLALDSNKDKEKWEIAFKNLVEAGIAKRYISSYVLIGYNTGPNDAWERCKWIEKFKIKAYPMWYHPLNTLDLNGITEDQKNLGWTNEERTKIMGFYYQHRQGENKGFIKRFHGNKNNSLVLM